MYFRAFSVGRNGCANEKSVYMHTNAHVLPVILFIAFLSASQYFVSFRKSFALHPLGLDFQPRFNRLRSLGTLQDAQVPYPDGEVNELMALLLS